MGNERQSTADPHAQNRGQSALSPMGFDPGEAIAAVSNVAREHPHAALVGAVAVGFLLGGGLTPRLLGAAALFAARRYFRMTVEETLASVQQGLHPQA